MNKISRLYTPAKIHGSAFLSEYNSRTSVFTECLEYCYFPASPSLEITVRNTGKAGMLGETKNIKE